MTMFIGVTGEALPPQVRFSARASSTVLAALTVPTLSWQHTRFSAHAEPSSVNQQPALNEDLTKLYRRIVELQAAELS